MPRNVWSRHLRKWSRLVSPSQPSPRCNCAIGGLSASHWHSPGCSVTLRSLLTDAAETEVANNLLHFHSNYLWAADMPHISEPNILSRIIARFLRIKQFKRMQPLMSVSTTSPSPEVNLWPLPRLTLSINNCFGSNLATSGSTSCGQNLKAGSRRWAAATLQGLANTATSIDHPLVLNIIIIITKYL